MNIDKIKVAYIEGRPSSHPTHAKFAKSVNAEFHFVDFKMRWQDKNRSILYRVTSWLICAFTFPNRKKFNVFYVDNLHFMPVIMKILFLRKRKQKIVVGLRPGLGKVRGRDCREIRDLPQDTLSAA